MRSSSPRCGLRLRDQPLSFSFDGVEVPAQAGDTVSSALLAHGIRLIGRSVKARRRRGVLTAGPEEPNALVTVGMGPALIPNVPATQLQVRNGLAVRSQNRWPCLRWDLASLLQAGGGLFSAGFYYKTFMWPSWRSYEPMIRSLAGLGSAPQACSLAGASLEHLSCDVLVAGGGPAGLIAALSAARSGARVVLCEREPALGGELEFESALIEEQPAMAWVDATQTELEARGVRVLLETAIVGGSNGQVIAHAEPGGLPGNNTLYRIRPTQLIIATGAVERPIAFIDNDRPGVMLLGAAERYLARYGVQVGRRIVIFGNHNRLYPAAMRLRAAGLDIRAVVDTRTPAQLHDSFVAGLREALIRSGVACLLGHVVTAAKGRAAVSGAQIAACCEAGRASILSASRHVACDTILMSGGWTPATHAMLQEGGSAQYLDEVGAFIAVEQPPWRVAVGAANGTFELAALCRQAGAAGLRAARSVGKADCAPAEASGRGDPQPDVVAMWRAAASRADEKRQFVDWQNDVTVADLRTAVEEGFCDIEHAKRYTALGFGTDQGRLAGVLGAGILAELREQPIEQVGVSRLRQPYHPVTMLSLAGLRIGNALRVERRTPLHDWHAAHGAVLEASGLWSRPRYYRTSGGAQVAQAAHEEARRVRTHGGIVDASTLGKIEIAGPDSAAFLDYVCLTRAGTLKVGRSRYAVSLREDGMVQDDGLLLRLAPDHFRMTTSTSHAELMLSHLEYWRASEWAARAVTITDVTDAWSTIALAGPRSREALLGVLEDRSRAAVSVLQHMQWTAGLFRALPLLVLRATYSGELGYEIHCPCSIALQVWEALVACGMAPYGLEALDILRLEKGYLTHSEMTGQTTPYDLGMHRFLQRSDDFVGRALLDRPAFHEPARPRLTGLRALDGQSAFLAGAQLVTIRDRSHPCGYVTSTAFSPVLGEWIGLALVARSIGLGESLIASDPLRSSETPVRVSSPVHFDPSGERMRT